MKRILITELEPGMILGQDISRTDGAILARTGTEVTSGMVSMVKRVTNIETVVVEGSSFANKEERIEWQKEQLRALIHRFSKSGDDPIMQRLRKLESDRIMSEE